MFRVFKCCDFSLDTKIKLLRCYIYPILSYGTETSVRKIEVLEMRICRQILNNSWTDRVYIYTT